MLFNPDLFEITGGVGYGWATLITIKILIRLLFSRLLCWIFCFMLLVLFITHALGHCAMSLHNGQINSGGKLNMLCMIHVPPINSTISFGVIHSLKRIILFLSFLPLFSKYYYFTHWCNAQNFSLYGQDFSFFVVNSHYPDELYKREHVLG